MPRAFRATHIRKHYGLAALHSARRPASDAIHDSLLYLEPIDSLSCGYVFDSNPFLHSVAVIGESGERGSINFPVDIGNVALPMMD